MIPKEQNEPTIERFFKVRITSVPVDIPLHFDMFLLVGDKPVHFRKPGDCLTKDRLRSLSKHGATEFLIPTDQREAYLDIIRKSVADPDMERSQKARIIKESAFVHVEDLFTKKDIKHVVESSKNLVQEMVNFVSEDVESAVSLMRLSMHDYYTYNHCVDVAVYAIALAKKLFGNDKAMLFHAGLGGLLHDLGKRKLDKKIINKTTPLTTEEWEEIKKHPDYGVEFLKDVKAIPEAAKQVVHQHHENFDGSGYPRGLSGEEISKLSRVVMIADVFDALTTDRSYHKAVTPTEALNTMFAMQPGKFDPYLFKTFNKNFEQRGSIELPKDFDPCQARHMVSQEDPED
ncbi:MAG: HD-GYP domain-containing protein [Bdellovibrionota bacterium]